MEQSLKKLKHIERISRQTRHHRTNLNQIYNQKLDEELNNLNNEYEQTFLRSKTNEILEQQRKQVLDVTIQQIAHERKRHSVSTNTIQILSKDIEDRPLPLIKPLSTINKCHLFSHDCQLYPCQPIYHYTSFIKKEHDQTLRQRNPSSKNLDNNSSSSHLQNLFTNIQEKKYQQDRRQLAVALQNQHHIANRHVYMKKTMARLDEQSRLLHERLADKKKFGYVKEHQYELKQAIQRHLTISAKFCA